MSYRSVRIILVLILMCALIVSGIRAQDNLPTPFFDGENALSHVANHVNVGPRPTATIGNIAAGNQIIAYLTGLGWQTSEDWHVIGFGDQSELSPEALITLEAWQPAHIGQLLVNHFAENTQAVSVDPLIIPVRNLVASYGSGSTIIIGAHYDSRIFSDKDPDESKRRLPMPGANDGGSGVGVLLELGRVLSEYYTPNQEIRFVFFDAEDNGRIEPFPSLIPSTSGYLVGSMLYASRLDLNSEDIEYMLLVDLVGEIDQEFPIEGYSAQSAPEIVEGIWTAAAELGYSAQFPNRVRGSITDDHVPFLQRGIRAVDIIDLDYAHWDTSEDTLDKIDPQSLERVGQVLEIYLERTGAITRK
ncbi:MAG: M28 family peptidase [Anaerolineae bacterium]|nr:M28 family peptidase [Anaerolineae bacterium]NUQ02508.1 M28 family peptidase [Anaerolineae bacterium]